MKTSLTRAAALCCALLAGTAIVVPAQAQEIAPPPAYTVSPTGVNLQDGRFTHQNEDLSIGPDGLGMKVVRFYSGLEPARHGNWTFNFNVYMFQLPSDTSTGTNPSEWEYKVNFVLGSTTIGFVKFGVALANGGYSYAPYDEFADGWLAQFSTATQKLTLTARDGTVYTFGNSNSSNQVESILHPNGLREDYTYVSGQLKSIFNNAGYGLTIERSGSNISKVCGINRSSVATTATSDCPASAPAATYAWGTSISSFTDPTGKVTSYEYDGAAQRLSCVRQPSTGPCLISNIYTGHATTLEKHDDRVVSQTTATGEAYSYVYNRPNPGPSDSPPLPPNDQTTVYGPTGTTVTALGSFGAPVPNAHTDELGRTTEYGWFGSKLTGIKHPEGNIGTFSLDSRGNYIEARQVAKAGTGLADIVRTASYSPNPCTNLKTCNKPQYIIDAKGNQTDFTYDPTHGGVLTETGPAVNGVRPQKRYTYAQKYAWVKDSGGTLVQAAAPVWLLTETAECQSQASCTGGADEVRTVVEYGAPGTANTLLPRGTVVDPAGLNLRSCAAYDDQGNKISETQPKAGLSVCS